MINRRWRPRTLTELAATVALAATLLAGCTSGSRPAPTTAGPAGPVGPAPRSTPSTATTTPPAPTLPPAAQQPTIEGAQAFARHFIALYNHAYETADASPVRAVSSPSCTFCTSTITSVEAVARDGDRTEGGGVTVLVAVASPEQAVDHVVVNLSVNQAAGRTLSRSGAVVATTPPRANGRIDIAVGWKTDRWMVLAAHALTDGES